jgi:hypothetical protein
VEACIPPGQRSTGGPASASWTATPSSSTEVSGFASSGPTRRRPCIRIRRSSASGTKRAVLHQRVRLERDPVRAHDKYGRTLGYVFRDDGFFLDAELVRQGYAHAIVHIPHPRMHEFRALERDAREHRRGLWGDGP